MAQLLDLPIEIFRLVLLAAYRARTLKRAFRLRLVNRLFASELLQVVNEHHLVQDDTSALTRLGNVGTSYVCYRLLHTRLPVTRHWANIKPISAHLTRHNNETVREEKYASYVKLLCEQYSRYSGSSWTLAAICHPVGEDGPDPHYDYRLRCAAAYFNDLPVLSKLHGILKARREKDIFVGNALAFAATAGHHEAVDFLREDALETILGSEMQYICKHSSPEIVRKLLPGPWAAERSGQKSSWPSYYPDARDLALAMQTPHVETFKMLLRVKEGSKTSYMDDQTLIALLGTAGANGWVEMTQYLLEKNFWNNRIKELGMGYFPAVRRGHTDVLRVYRQQFPGNDWKYRGTEVGLAASMGKWDMVRYLVTERLDINDAVTPVVVSAVRWEREDLVRELIGLGAIFDEKVRSRAMREARDDGLESMLDLLQELDVGAEDGVKRKE